MKRARRLRDPDRQPSEENRRHRLLGRYGGDHRGPLVIGIGGLHGNEPAGVDALRRVLERLSRDRPLFRGEFVALAGNLVALARGVRYVSRDLNRIWTLERIGRLDAARGAPAGDVEGGKPLEAEDREQAELLFVLENLLEAHRSRPDEARVYVLDLHTTSSESPPFLTFSDSLRNRGFARRFPLPRVLGLEEEVPGTLLDWVDHLGHVGLGVEGGQHEDPSSVDHLEAAVWLALLRARSLRLSDLAEGRRLRDRLRKAVLDVSPALEVRYRHQLREGDRFRMEPGYRNFQPVEEGEPVARDRNGVIRAPMSGRIFLPLYQRQGAEGFFLVEEVRPVWLWISDWLRRLRVDVLARRLPGVRPHPGREKTVVVHPRVARPAVVKLFHLLGYRHERSDGARLVLTRRKEVAEEFRNGAV